MGALDTQIGGSHYRNGGIQPVQYIEANGLLFLEGCVVKRVTRHDQPTGKGRQDIEKSIHELQLLLELRYPVVSAAKQAPIVEQVFDPAKHAMTGESDTALCGACHTRHSPLAKCPMPNARIFKNLPRDWWCNDPLSRLHC